MGRLISALPGEGKDALVALFEIGAETALGEVGAADDRLGLGAGLKVKDLRMETARPVLRDIGIGHVNEAVD